MKTLIATLLVCCTLIAGCSTPEPTGHRFGERPRWCTSIKDCYYTEAEWSAARDVIDERKARAELEAKNKRVADAIAKGQAEARARAKQKRLSAERERYFNRVSSPEFQEAVIGKLTEVNSDSAIEAALSECEYDAELYSYYIDYKVPLDQLDDWSSSFDDQHNEEKLRVEQCFVRMQHYGRDVWDDIFPPDSVGREGAGYLPGAGNLIDDTIAKLPEMIAEKKSEQRRAQREYLDEIDDKYDRLADWKFNIAIDELEMANETKIRADAERYRKRQDQRDAELIERRGNESTAETVERLQRLKEQKQVGSSSITLRSETRDFDEERRIRLQQLEEANNESAARSDAERIKRERDKADETAARNKRQAAQQQRCGGPCRTIDR